MRVRHLDSLCTLHDHSHLSEFGHEHIREVVVRNQPVDVMD